MIARFDAIEQLTAGSLAARRMDAANEPATGRRRPAMRLDAALAAWEIQSHRTLANHPDPADLVRAARVQALIATTTVVVGEARAAVANQTGWATPDEIAGRIDLPSTAMTLHRSPLAGVELAYVTREIAADHPGLAAPARVIAMRVQGEAEVAIEQGETRFEGVRWVTTQQLATNQVIPLPEPARRGLINAATDVAAATNRPSLQSPSFSAPNLRRVSERTVLGVSAESPGNVRFRSVIRTEEVAHDEPNHICNQ
jgi:hypothetical protein